MNRVIAASLAAVLLAGITLAQQPEQQPPQKVDINKASAEELRALPAIGKSRAEMIIRIRERNGPFKRVEELRALPRLSEAQFEKLRQLVTVGPAAPEEDGEHQCMSRTVLRHWDL